MVLKNILVFLVLMLCINCKFNLRQLLQRDANCDMFVFVANYKIVNTHLF
jgi:hypothetical protein